MRKCVEVYCRYPKHMASFRLGFIYLSFIVVNWDKLMSQRGDSNCSACLNTLVGINECLMYFLYSVERNHMFIMSVQPIVV